MSVSSVGFLGQSSELESCSLRSQNRGIPENHVAIFIADLACAVPEVLASVKFAVPAWWQEWISSLETTYVISRT